MFDQVIFPRLKTVSSNRRTRYHREHRLHHLNTVWFHLLISSRATRVGLCLPSPCDPRTVTRESESIMFYDQGAIITPLHRGMSGQTQLSPSTVTIAAASTWQTTISHNAWTPELKQTNVVMIETRTGRSTIYTGCAEFRGQGCFPCLRLQIDPIPIL